MVCVVYVWKKIINNMIAVIMIMIGIVLIVSSIIEWHQTNKRVKVLENRLKDIEYKNKKTKLIKRGLEWPE